MGVHADANVNKDKTVNVQDVNKNNRSSSRKFGSLLTGTPYAGKDLAIERNEVMDKISLNKENVKAPLYTVRKAAPEDSCGVQYGDILINLVADGNAVTINAMDFDASKLGKDFNYNETWRTESRIVDNVSVSQGSVDIQGRALIMIFTGKEGMQILIASTDLKQVWMTSIPMKLVFRGNWEDRLHYQENGISDPLLSEITDRGVTVACHMLGKNGGAIEGMYEIHHVPFSYPVDIMFLFNESGKTADWKISAPAADPTKTEVSVKNGEDVIGGATIYYGVGEQFHHTVSKLKYNGVPRSPGSYIVKFLNEKLALAFGTGWDSRFDKQVGGDYFGIPQDKPGFETVEMGSDLYGKDRKVSYYSGNTIINDTTYLDYTLGTRNKVVVVHVPREGQGGGFFVLADNPLDISDVDRVLNLLIASNSSSISGTMTGDSKRKGKEDDRLIVYYPAGSIKVDVDLMKQLSDPDIASGTRNNIQALSGGEVVNEVSINLMHGVPRVLQ